MSKLLKHITNKHKYYQIINKKLSVVISEKEINSEKSTIPEKINEDNLVETKIPQILIQEEEEEVSAEEEEATTVAVSEF